MANESVTGPEGTDLTRIVAFTDGVFAIAITLLVLNFDVPETGDLHKELDKLLPDLGAYFLSFAVIARFWVIHHRVFATLRSFDRRLMALNLLYLSLIVLVPFTTELLSDYGDDAPAPITYALVLALASSVNWLMIRTSLSAGHVRAQERDRTVPFASAEALHIPVVFFLSIPLALLSALAAELSWLLLVVTRPLFGWRHRRTDSPTTSE